MDKYDILEKEINWKSLLISNYRKLGLSEDEVIAILVVQDFIDQNEKMITPEMLEVKMNFNTEKISNILTQLVNKSLLFFEEDRDGKMNTTLKGIKKLLIDDLVSTPDLDETNSSSLLSDFENSFGRPLSYAEIQLLRTWIEEGYEEDKIRLALTEALAAKAKNLKYIDKILLNWRQQEERVQEGYTTISEDWHKNMEETLTNKDIKWADKNDK